MFAGTEKTAYEVIRIIDGKPLFLPQHIERLQNSLKQINKTGILPTVFKTEVNSFIRQSGIVNGNIRIDAFYNNNLEYRFYQIAHHYPHENDFCKGVKVVTIAAERENPECKIWNDELRNKANQIIETSRAWEALLVDKEGNITEGSRSNFFVIHGTAVFSAPEAHILSGITRHFVIEAIKNIPQVQYFETDIPLSRLAEYDASFITGTSIKVLPIRKIDKYCFDVKNLILSQIMSNFETILQRELNRIKE